MRSLFVLLAWVSAAIALPAVAADRVLLMTIAEYQRAPLPGAARDQDNVRQILREMNVAQDNLRSLRDQELPAAAIRAEFERLARETQDGDRVFVFFSGHGSSRLIDGRCQQALVGQDMQAVNPADISSALSAIKDKASKVVMVIDACHSGGLVSDAKTRSTKASRFRAKFADPDNPNERCSKPVNVVEERITGMRSSRGAPLSNNYLYLAAARADEVAFDDEGTGGLATSSLLACLKAGVPDTDGSASVSFSELANCAQGRINGLLAGDPVNRPHHIVMTGNPQMPIVGRAVATAGPTPQHADPVATLRDLANGADSRWMVALDAKPPRAKIDRDAFVLTATSSQAGYLTLLYVGSDGKEFARLYPYEAGQEQRVAANVAFRIPGEFASHGPAGTNRVLALVTEAPRDFADVLGKQGVATATRSTAAALQDQLRNLKGRPSGAGTVSAGGSYGARLIDLVEEL